MPAMRTDADLPQSRRASRRLLPLTARRLLCSVVVGLVAGLGASLFYYLLQAALAFFLGYLCHYFPPEAGGEPSLFAAQLAAVPRQPIVWLLVLMPALGGLLSGWLVFTIAPEAEGHGTDAAILAFHRLGGFIRPIVPLLKLGTSVITIGTGGSGGREGPIAQIGAGFGSYLAARLRFPERERRLLMLAGLGAGVGAIFKAPLAGAIFAGEVLYAEEELEYEALVPATIASIISYAVFVSFFGTAPVFRSDNVAFEHPLELAAYVLLGFVCAVGGWLYIRCFYGTRDLFHKLPVRPHWRPAVGGLLTGLVGLVMPAALATGYGSVQRALDGDPTLTVGFLIGLALLKIPATSLSIGSGGSGGVFGPAMVIGGALGGATGLICQRLGLVEEPSAMVMVGMAGFFAGAAKTPLSTIIMVSEMTGNYNLLVPSMCTCTIAALLLRHHSLYENQVRNRTRSPAHTGELAVDLLQALRVADWMNREQQPMAASLRLPELIARMADAPHTRQVVVDDQHQVVGILDVRDVLCVVNSLEAGEINASTLANPHLTAVHPDQDLHVALALLDEDPHGMLVVRAADDGPLLGVLRRQDVLHAYHEAGERMLQTVHRTPAGALHVPADLTVGEAMSLGYPTIAPETRVEDLANLFRESGHHGFPVVDSHGRLVGMVTLGDLIRVPEGIEARVADIASTELITCCPYETLVEALRKFGRHEVGRLPVVDPADPERLLGVLRRGDVIDTLAQAASELPSEAGVVHALDVPRARFVELLLDERSRAVGQQVRDLALPADSLLISVRRSGSLLVPHGETRLEAGDRVVVLCELEAVAAVRACLGERS